MSGAHEITPRGYARLMERFDALCDLSTDDQAIELAILRADDPAAARELERLLLSDTGSTLVEGAAARFSILAADAAAGSGPSGEADAGEAAAHLLGQTLDGRWLVEELLGGGGFGHVYRARGESGTVAIKVLRPERTSTGGGAGHDEHERRFRREFLAVSGLSHPGCLRVFAEGVHDRARYIVMEFAAGGDLRRFAGAGPRVLLPLLRQVAEALDYVHAHGIVHRDLKPANVLIDGGEPPRALLADFGIAKLTHEGLSMLSSRGLLMGTIDFVSPEQVMGQPVDARSDLFALGCMIFSLMSGRPPWEGSAFDRLAGRVDRDAPPLSSVVPSVPPGLDELTAELLQRAPSARPATAREVALRLAALAT